MADLQVDCYMTLESIDVFDVAQQRTAETVIKPKGGECKSITPEFLDSLESYSKQQRIESKPSIELVRERSSGGEHPVRKLLIRYAFRGADERSKAAAELAQKLGESMDERTPRLLLLLTLHAIDATRCVTMWAFPKDDPIQFESKKLLLRNVRNAFSKRSTFAKCARFQGVDSPNSFWRGFVIDRSNSTSANPALYWTSTFLDGKLSLTSSHATYQLSNVLKSVLKSTSNQSERQELSEAVVALRALQREEWSFQEVADRLLTNNNKDRFLELAPPKERETKFKLDLQSFESNLGYTVYTTDDGVIISAPNEALPSTTLSVEAGRIKLEGNVSYQAFAKRGRRSDKRA